ncbi:hypothetical protein QCB45_10015 [Thiomicrorhabdus sp. ZW0627]|uniref:hypothetical protein n=1 Tax=Thiomicrorhabdus sp. ZW0627 TaxID=3039774 RepID=UPI0024366330|nr:hypothetical protein [Thiomicrorhabdus sp. ZW0627]MDG6774667.1 hypothetical protein [Thiomicrorhabdus sp. ZW0627]
MKRVFPLFSLMLIPFFLSGCTTLRDIYAPEEKNLLSGAGAIAAQKPENCTGNDCELEAQKYQLIDMKALLKEYGFNDPELVSEDLSKSQKYRYLRNELQDRLIAASNQRCGAYIRMLSTAKAQSKMGWGAFATLLSGAASVTTPAAASQLLSAGSTVANGVLSLYNESYFNNLTVNVISAGITKQREGLLLQINDQRKLDLSEYPVNRAISDALLYHSKCNIVSGLEAASIATKLASGNSVAQKIRSDDKEDK